MQATQESCWNRLWTASPCQCDGLCVCDLDPTIPVRRKSLPAMMPVPLHLKDVFVPPEKKPQQRPRSNSVMIRKPPVGFTFSATHIQRSAAQPSKLSFPEFAHLPPSETKLNLAKKYESMAVVAQIRVKENMETNKIIDRLTSAYLQPPKQTFASSPSFSPYPSPVFGVSKSLAKASAAAAAAANQNVATTQPRPLPRSTVSLSLGLSDSTSAASKPNSANTLLNSYLSSLINQIEQLAMGATKSDNYSLKQNNPEFNQLNLSQHSKQIIAVAV